MKFLQIVRVLRGDLPIVRGHTRVTAERVLVGAHLRSPFQRGILFRLHHSQWEPEDFFALQFFAFFVSQPLLFRDALLSPFVFLFFINSPSSVKFPNFLSLKLLSKLKVKLFA